MYPMGITHASQLIDAHDGVHPKPFDMLASFHLLAPIQLLFKALDSYVKVSRDLDYLNFFLKKLLLGPMKVKLRHLWLRWS